MGSPVGSKPRPVLGQARCPFFSTNIRETWFIAPRPRVQVPGPRTKCVPSLFCQLIRKDEALGVGVFFCLLSVSIVHTIAVAEHAIQTPAAPGDLTDDGGLSCAPF